MSMSPGFTHQEIRAYVYEYQALPWGTRKEWIDARPFSRHQLSRWQAAVFGGDLERGLVPREGSGMTQDPQSLRVLAEHQRSVSRADHDREVTALQARIDALEGANEALGKAIGLLHSMNAQEPAIPVMNEGPSSLQPKTL